ncbi:MAG: PTS sugar transporter subunit IIA [Acidobacteriota bacterium]|jgi:mannitol/fructose-specific phosphotransferase system IIA component (Ntr-type)|nr:PTS sugar transporter subunit IIA [Acidobacteriota bacterium]
MKLANYLKKENIYICDTCKDTGHLYGDFAHFLKEKGMIADARKVKRLFVKRESVQSTGIGHGVATPHVFSDEFSEFFLAMALVRKGIDFKAPDGKDVHLVFLIMSDDRDIGLHLKTLAHLARLTASCDLVAALGEARDEAEAHKIILEKEKAILN